MPVAGLLGGDVLIWVLWFICLVVFSFLVYGVYGVFAIKVERDFALGVEKPSFLLFILFSALALLVYGFLNLYGLVRRLMGVEVDGRKVKEEATDFVGGGMGYTCGEGVEGR